MNLNDYFLVKCFGKQEYMNDFNSGKNIHLKNTGYFWKLENAFQQDLEGLIFQQSGKGYYFEAGSEFEKLVRECSSPEEIKERAEKEGIGKVKAETTNMSFRLNGYICCFYLLPKTDITFSKDIFSITSESQRKDIEYFIKRYMQESNIEEVYVSIYDAYTLCTIFCNEMKNRGYEVTLDIVEYKDVDMKTRIRWFQEKKYKSIAFTKDTKYSYQKEFRIFIGKNGEHSKDFISETGIAIYNSVAAIFNVTD